MKLESHRLHARALSGLGRAIKQVIEDSSRGAAQEISVTCWDEDDRFFDPANSRPAQRVHPEAAQLRWGDHYPRTCIPRGRKTAAPGAATAPHPVKFERYSFEIGACMARYGRKRVFRLKPKTAAWRSPSYFAQNNANFVTYDDGAEPGPASISDAAQDIVSRLSELGQAAFYSDLPAFGLAHGYFNNFVQPAIRNVERGAIVYAKSREGFLKGRRKRKFSAAVFVIAVPEDRIVNRTEMRQHLISIGLIEAVIEVQDGRDITFFTIPDFRSKDALYLIEVPTNLIASKDAIGEDRELVD